MKNSKIKYWSTFAITFIFCTAVFAQKDYDFVSSGQQKLLLNPSFAGNRQGLQIQTLGAAAGNLKYSPFTQIYSGIDYGLKNGLGIGLSFTNYNQNRSLYISNQIDASFSYKIKLNEKITFVPSLQASYLERQMDLTGLWIAQEPWPSEITTGEFKKQNATFSTGFIFDFNKRFTFGASFFDVNQPDIGLLGAQKRNLSQIYHFSGILFKEKPVSLQPYLILKHRFGSDKSVEEGFFITYKIFSFQTAVRTFFRYGENPIDLSSIHATDLSIIAGLSCTFKGARLGYTFNSSGNYGFRGINEFFISARLFNKEKKTERCFFVD